MRVSPRRHSAAVTSMCVWPRRARSCARAASRVGGLSNHSSPTTRSWSAAITRASGSRRAMRAALSSASRRAVSSGLARSARAAALISASSMCAGCASTARPAPRSRARRAAEALARIRRGRSGCGIGALSCRNVTVGTPRGARHILPGPLSSWPGMMTDLPNLLTLSRIAAIPLIVALVAVRHPAADLAACVVFSVAAITDYFDGRIARGRRQTSDLGRMLDPIADKLLVGATLMMLAGMGRLPGFSLYPAVVILLREILVSGLREYLAGIRIGLPVTRLAKWKTGFQMGAVGTLLAGDSSAHLLHLSFLPVSLIGEIMLWVAAALTLVTGWDYLTAGLRHAASPASSGTSQAGSAGPRVKTG